DPEHTRAGIKSAIEEIKGKCADNPALYKDFLLIEKPLIFFIDYIIKEGGFSFSKSWRELGRDYGELSGDEKFYDILAETLDDPNSKERIEMFFLMMGLGFDGVYKKEPETIERKMKVCAARLDAMPDISKDYITYTEPLASSGPPPKSFFKSGIFIVALSAFIAFIALGFNYYILHDNTSSFRQAVEEAAISASPYGELAGNEVSGEDK
ncbi:MAG: DotU family type IV/VI secretion system protein, partial [Deferribacterales bacterium]|nr:DotU family type IV/VI secretion system protein [Deferribacterales bacterium]